MLKISYVTKDYLDSSHCIQTAPFNSGAELKLLLALNLKKLLILSVTNVAFCTLKFCGWLC